MARAVIGSSMSLRLVLELFDLGEGCAVGEGLVDLVLGLFLAGEVLVLAGGVGVPPGEVGRDLERPQFLRVGVEELAGLLGHLRAGGGRRRVPEEEDRQCTRGRQHDTQTEHRVNPFGLGRSRPRRSRGRGRSIVAGRAAGRNSPSVAASGPLAGSAEASKRAACGYAARPYNAPRCAPDPHDGLLRWTIT